MAGNSMRILFHSMVFSLCGSLLLVACDPPQKQPTWNLYALPATGQASGDYDANYTQPHSYNSCESINDSPSCGGSD
jgi:hypothetical protein